MSSRVRLALVLHNHQPVGNFENVFEEAYRTSYRPFLDKLIQHPEIRCALHNSGSLLEWLVDRHPEYVDDLRRIIKRGQVELLGGAFFEPILGGIPRHDRIGQIQSYTRYLEQVFETTIRGMWMPERVWEQSFASDLVTAGIEYTLLDDYHFRSAGLNVEELHGYYLTEDEGKLLRVFPNSEKLRYLMPFSDPMDVINALREYAESIHNPVIVFGDDGEKFGSWPGTYQHVYENGWLDRFFALLGECSDWIQLVNLGDVIDSDAATGLCYLPDCSYREMTEWVMPTRKQRELEKVIEVHGQDPDWDLVKQFIRGGVWRNFRSKYSEAQEMYARMMEVSRHVEEFRTSGLAADEPQVFADARAELYRGQCNCPYWHGAFGGLYIPHLRQAIYRHLITAEDKLLEIEKGTDPWVEVSFRDYDLDDEEEVKISSDQLAAYLKPSMGGALYELDIKSVRHNLLSTLNRRREPYHRKIRKAAEEQQSGGGSIEDLSKMMKFKQPDLHKQIVYDTWPRKSLVDHLLLPGASFDQLLQGRARIAKLHEKRFDFITDETKNGVLVRMLTRINWVGRPVLMTKEVGIERDAPSALQIRYGFENLPPGQKIHFGIEFNFAGMAGEEDDRYFYDGKGRQFGPLSSRLDWTDVSRIGLVDEWLGIDTALDFSIPSGIWAIPIQTVSQSEGGYELVFQSCSVMPHWEFVVPENGRWNIEILFSADTSLAQARQLAATGVAAH